MDVHCVVSNVTYRSRYSVDMATKEIKYGFEWLLASFLLITVLLIVVFLIIFILVFIILFLFGVRVVSLPKKMD